MILNIASTILVIQIILSLGLYCFFSFDLGSFILGGAISFINFVFLAFIWGLIIYKKRVAPAIVIVVIKYGILIYLFSMVPRVSWIKQNDLVFGILVNPAAILLGGFFIANRSKKVN